MEVEQREKNRKAKNKQTKDYLLYPNTHAEENSFSNTKERKKKITLCILRLKEKIYNHRMTNVTG